MILKLGKNELQPIVFCILQDQATKRLQHDKENHCLVIDLRQAPCAGSTAAYEFYHGAGSQEHDGSTRYNQASAGAQRK